MTDAPDQELVDATPGRGVVELEQDSGDCLDLANGGEPRSATGARSASRLSPPPLGAIGEQVKLANANVDACLKELPAERLTGHSRWGEMFRYRR